jgi:hypothetical protein
VDVPELVGVGALVQDHDAVRVVEGDGGIAAPPLIAFRKGPLRADDATGSVEHARHVEQLPVVGSLVHDDDAPRVIERHCRPEAPARVSLGQGELRSDDAAGRIDGPGDVPELQIVGPAVRDDDAAGGVDGDRRRIAAPGVAFGQAELLSDELALGIEIARDVEEPLVGRAFVDDDDTAIGRHRHRRMAAPAARIGRQGQPVLPAREGQEAVRAREPSRHVPEPLIVRPLIDDEEPPIGAQRRRRGLRHRLVGQEVRQQDLAGKAQTRSSERAHAHVQVGGVLAAPRHQGLGSVQGQRRREAPWLLAGDELLEPFHFVGVGVDVVGPGGQAHRVVVAVPDSQVVPAGQLGVGARMQRVHATALAVVLQRHPLERQRAGRQVSDLRAVIVLLYDGQSIELRCPAQEVVVERVRLAGDHRRDSAGRVPGRDRGAQMPGVPAQHLDDAFEEEARVLLHVQDQEELVAVVVHRREARFLRHDEIDDLREGRAHRGRAVVVHDDLAVAPPVVEVQLDRMHLLREGGVDLLQGELHARNRMIVEHDRRVLKLVDVSVLREGRRDAEEQGGRRRQSESDGAHRNHGAPSSSGRVSRRRAS